MREVSCSDDEEPPSKKKKMVDNSDEYKKLISLMVGSQYASFQSQTPEIFFQSASEDMKKTTKRIIGLASTSSEFPDQRVKFPDLPGKPLGDIRR